MAITPFSAVPSRATGQDTFSADVETFWGQLPTFVNEVNAFGAGLSSQITTSSVTSLLVGTGSKTLTVGTGLGFQIGYPVRIAYSDSIHMTGTVTSYNPTTGELICNITSSTGSGTYAVWSVYAIPASVGASLVANKFTGLQTFADEVAVASASTINLTTADSNNVEITGTTTITAVTMPEGAVIKARASGAFQLTNSSSLIVQGGANYTTTVNDILTFTKDGAGNVHVEINKINGQAVTSITVTSSSSDPTYASTSDTNPATPSWINGRLVARVFTSADQTMTAGGLLTIAHGLGAVPKRVYLQLKCTTADGVYALNDIIEIAGVDEGSAQSAGTTVRKDATNIYVRVGSGGILILNTSGSVFNITLSNYRLIAKAEL